MEWRINRNKQQIKYIKMRNLNQLSQEAQSEIFELIYDAANENRLSDVYACDAHNEIFNTDYFIVGRYEAQKWLENNIGVFQAIDIVTEYEENNFGAVTTEISDPERLVNMLVYIVGEEAMQQISTFNKNWDNRLTEKQCGKIAKKANKLMQ
jgi:hypothetical protein